MRFPAEGERGGRGERIKCRELRLEERGRRNEGRTLNIRGERRRSRKVRIGRNWGKSGCVK